MSWPWDLDWTCRRGSFSCWNSNWMFKFAGNGIPIGKNSYLKTFFLAFSIVFVQRLGALFCRSLQCFHPALAHARHSAEGNATASGWLGQGRPDGVWGWIFAFFGMIATKPETKKSKHKNHQGTSENISHQGGIALIHPVRTTKLIWWITRRRLEPTSWQPKGPRAKQQSRGTWESETFWGGEWSACWWVLECFSQWEVVRLRALLSCWCVWLVGLRLSGGLAWVCGVYLLNRFSTCPKTWMTRW